MGVTIVVEGIVQPARLGVTEAERSLPQPIELSVEFVVADEPIGDDLATTVDYSVLDRVVPEVLATACALVETLAARLADAIVAALGWARLERVSVRVTKLAPPLALAGARVHVAVVRVRDGGRHS